MAWPRGYLLILVLALPPLASACNTADQDRTAARRVLAQKTCEDAILGQLSSRSTAQFTAGSEHVYYDSAGGAAVAGVVVTVKGERNFACILKPASDSDWTLTNARLLN
jgi:hypothetical protein